MKSETKLMKCVIRAEGKTKRKWRAPSIPTKTMPLILEYLVPPAMFIHTNICRYKSISMPVPCILCRHGSAGKNVSLLGLNKTMHNVLTRNCLFFLFPSQYVFVSWTWGIIEQDVVSMGVSALLVCGFSIFAGVFLGVLARRRKTVFGSADAKNNSYSSE